MHLTQYFAGRLYGKLMIMYEQDPDIFRWGLHHLLGDMSISDYGGTTAQNSANNHEVEYVTISNFGTDQAAVENDEVIAHALQEEFSNVAVAEASGHTHSGEEHQQVAVLVQDWFTGNERTHEVAEDREPSSRGSSPGEKLYEGEVPIELTDEFSSFDGEVGKRLNNMVPIPVSSVTNFEFQCSHNHKYETQCIADHLESWSISLITLAFFFFECVILCLCLGISLRKLMITNHLLKHRQTYFE